MSEDRAPERRHFNNDGSPNYAELAYSSLSSMFSSPVREEAAKWGRAAHVHALLAQRESMQDLARSNRELAASYDALVDEMRIKRGVPADPA